jgi:hypothetical protein
LLYLCGRLLFHLDICVDWRIAIGHLFGHGCLVGEWKGPRQHFINSKLQQTRRTPKAEAWRVSDFTPLDVYESPCLTCTLALQIISSTIPAILGHHIQPTTWDTSRMVSEELEREEENMKAPRACWHSMWRFTGTDRSLAKQQQDHHHNHDKLTLSTCITEWIPNQAPTIP